MQKTVFLLHSFIDENRIEIEKRMKIIFDGRLLIDALRFLFFVCLLVFINFFSFYTRVTRIRFLEYLLICSVEVFDDAVLEDCRLSSIQLFVRFDVAFIELFAVVVPLLLPIDVLDTLVAIILSQLLALLLLLLVALFVLLLVLFAVLVFVSFTFE